MQTFHLSDQEFIQLNDLLKHLALVSTGGEAKFLIQNGEVKVNGEIEFRLRKKLRQGDKVELNSEIIWIQ